MGWLRGNVFVVLLLVVLLSMKEKRARRCGRQRYSAIVRTCAGTKLADQAKVQGGRGGAVAVPDSREPIVVVDVGPCTECAGQVGGGGRGGLC